MRIKKKKFRDFQVFNFENSEISEILFTSNFDTGCNSRFKTTSEK